MRWLSYLLSFWALGALAQTPDFAQRGAPQQAGPEFAAQYERCLKALSLSLLVDDTPLQELQALLVIYQEMPKRGATKEAIAEGKKSTQALFLEVAILWHSAGQKTKSKALLERAEKLYKAYRIEFGDAKDLYEVTWSHAELLFQLAEMGDDKRWESAAEAYQAVLDLAPNGKYTKEASRAVVVAWQNVMQRDPSTTPINKEMKELPIPERQAKMLKAFAFYVEMNPASSDVVGLVFEQGMIYYDYLHLKEAEAKFSFVVEKHSNEKSALRATQYLMDVYILQKKNTELRALAEKIVKDPTLSKDQPLVERAALIQMQMTSRRCQELYESREWEDATECYAKLYDENKTHPDAAKILFNLAIAAENAKQIDLAISTRKRLLDNAAFSKTREAARSLYALGRLYLNVGDFKEAAEYFERFAEQYGGEADALNALENAAILREALGETEKAINAMKKLSLLSQMKADAARANFRIAEIRQRSGDATKASAAYEQYIKSYGVDGTTEHLLRAKGAIAAILWKDKKQEKALKQCREVLTLTDQWMSEAPDKLRAIEELNRGLDAAAECQFYLAEERFEAFQQQMKLPAKATPQQLTEWLNTTQKERAKLTALYLKTREYSSKEWSLAALTRIGMISYLMLDALSKTAANDFTETLKADALKAFEVCIEGSLQSRWHNEWSSICEGYLVILDPERWTEATEWIPAPSYEPMEVRAPEVVGLD